MHQRDDEHDDDDQSTNDAHAQDFQPGRFYLGSASTQHFDAMMPPSFAQLWHSQLRARLLSIAGVPADRVQEQIDQAAQDEEQPSEPVTLDDLIAMLGSTDQAGALETMRTAVANHDHWHDDRGMYTTMEENRIKFLRWLEENGLVAH